MMAWAECVKVPKPEELHQRHHTTPPSFVSFKTTAVGSCRQLIKRLQCKTSDREESERSLDCVMAGYWVLTQQALQGPDGIVKRPALTAALTPELLQRPPFRFLQDIIAEARLQSCLPKGARSNRHKPPGSLQVIATTGYAADLLQGPEAATKAQAGPCNVPVAEQVLHLPYSSGAHRTRRPRYSILKGSSRQWRPLVVGLLQLMLLR